MFDVLGAGICALDTLIYVDGYPPADSKIQVRASHRRVGGLCAAALLTVARLGGRAAYAGMLGHDPGSQEVLAALRQAGVDVNMVRRVRGAGPVLSTVVVDTSAGTRTIFFDDSRPHGPPPEDIIVWQTSNARVLLIDHHNAPKMLVAARQARGLGMAVVADFERSDDPEFEFLLQAANHLILSYSFAAAVTGQSGVEAVISALWQYHPVMVALTHGEQGVWFRSAEHEEIFHQAAFPVRAIDPTGCGDVFHGAYALRLAEGAPVGERIRFAAAAAALKAARPGGAQALPTRVEVEGLLMGIYPDWLLHD